MTTLLFYLPLLFQILFDPYSHSSCCLISLTEWVIVPHWIFKWQALVILYYKDLLMCLCSKMSVHWGLTYNMIFVSTLISLTHTHIQSAQCPKDWHCHILLCYCISTTLLIYISIIGYVLTAAIRIIYTKWIIRWYKKFTLKSSTISLLLKNAGKFTGMFVNYIQ